MSRLWIGTLVLAVLMGCSLVPPAYASRDSAGGYSVFPREIAEVVALAPRGLATIRTRNGALYQVGRGLTWRVGDTVECEHAARSGPSIPPWETLNCHKIS